MRTMHGFMAAGCPASAAGKRTAMVTTTNEDNARSGLFLKVAFQAERGIALHEHLAVDRAMHLVAGGAAFAHRLVLENKWPTLRCVTLPAGFSLNRGGKWPAVSGVPFVRIMAIVARYFPFEHRMMVRQVELPAFVEMTLKANLGILARVDDRIKRATALVVQTAGAMTRFATGVVKVWTFRL